MQRTTLTRSYSGKAQQIGPWNEKNFSTAKKATMKLKKQMMDWREMPVQFVSRGMSCSNASSPIGVKLS